MIAEVLIVVGPVSDRLIVALGAAVPLMVGVLIAVGVVTVLTVGVST